MPEAQREPGWLKGPGGFVVEGHRVNRSVPTSGGSEREVNFGVF